METTIKKITGFAFIDGSQKQLSYTYNEYDENGNILKANIRKSKTILDTNTDVLTNIKAIQDYLVSGI